MNQNFSATTMLHNISEEQLMNYFTRINAQFVELKNSIVTKPNEELLTREEVAKFLKCDLSTVHNLKKEGILPYYKLKGRVYFKKHEVMSALIPVKNKKR